MVFGEEISFNTRGFSDIIDVTSQVQDIVTRSGLSAGIACIFCIGSTASVSTIEYEGALVEDFKDQLEGFAPENMETRHGSTWGDDNGFSHIRATFMGPGIQVPFRDSRLILGTWQQIVVIDHDNRPRNRKVFIQLLGE